MYLELCHRGTFLVKKGVPLVIADGPPVKDFASRVQPGKGHPVTGMLKFLTREGQLVTWARIYFEMTEIGNRSEILNPID